MSEPGGGGGSVEIGKGHIVVDMKDNTAAGLRSSQKNIDDHNKGAQRSIQNTAQIARNSVSLVTRAVGSNVTNTALEPIISLGEAFTRVAEEAEYSGTKMQKAFQAAQVFGGGILAVGTSLTLLGSKETQASNQLNNAIDNLGLSSADYVDKVEEVVKQQENFGHSAIQTKSALQILVGATHDPTQALESMGEVADLAASRHTSLDQAAKQVAITIGGGGRLLKAYNIDIIRNADGTRNYAAMNEKLAEVLNGQAASASTGFLGTLRRTGAQLDDLTATIGQKYGHVLMAAGFGLLVWGSVMRAVTSGSMKNMATATIQQVTATKLQTKAVQEGAAATESSSALQIEAINGLTAAYERMAGAAGAAGTAAGEATAFNAGMGAGAAAGAASGAAASHIAGNEAVAASDIRTVGQQQAAEATSEAILAKQRASWAETTAWIAAANAEAGGSEEELATATAAARQASADAAQASAAVIVAANREQALAGAVAKDEMVAEEAASTGLLASMGPLGIGLTVVAGALALFGFASSSSGAEADKAKYEVQGLTEAIKANYGEVNNASVSLIDLKAAELGLLPAFEKLGGTQDQFNKLILGGDKGFEEYLAKFGNLGVLAGQIANKDFGTLSFIKAYGAIKQLTPAQQKQVETLKEVIQKYKGLKEAVGGQIETAKNEASVTGNLSDAEILQAKSLGIQSTAYEDLKQKAADAAAKKQSDIQTNLVAIMTSDQLAGALGMTADAYERLAGSIGIAVGKAQSSMSQFVDSIDLLHTEFDPVLSAYDTWQQSIQAVTDAEASQTKSIQSATKQVTDAKKAEIKAEQAVTDAEKQGRQDIAKAETDLSKARDKAAQDLIDANQKVIDSEKAAKDATDNVRIARQAAEKQIEDSIRSLRDLAENEAKARDDLLTAQLDSQQKAHDAAQDALNKNTNLTQQQLIDAQNKLNADQDRIDKQRANIDKRNDKNAIIDAQHKLTDLIRADNQARKDTNKIIKEGVDQNPDVLKAEDAQKTAIDNVTKAKKAQAQTEKDTAQTIKDAEQAVRDARVKAAKAVSDAMSQQQDAVSRVNDAESNLQDTMTSSTRSINTARDAVDKNRAKLTELEIQTGQTDTSLKNLKKTMDTMDKSLTLTYQAKGVRAVGQDTVDLQRAIEETLLEAGGTSVADAIKKAKADIPDWQPQTNGSGGGQGGGHPVVHASAAGGPIFGPGTETSDSIPAMLSNNEHVWTAAEVQAAGGHDTVMRLRQAALEGAIAGYAGGGPVIDATKMNIRDRLKNSGYLSLLGKGYYGSDKYGGSEQGWPTYGATLDFIRGVDSHPYVFGAVGPNSYDCSGLVGEVWARLTGHPDYKRYFTTDNEAQFFEPGPGLFSVGVTNHPGGTQHTAGRLGTLKFEARDEQEGIIVGPSATAPEQFEHVYHLKPKSGYLPSGGAGIGNTGASGKLSPDAARAAGRQMMPNGWSFDDLNALWNQESGWRWDATGTPVHVQGYSGLHSAYGIPQSLPDFKMASAGADWKTNAVTQMKWGLDYIKSAYGNSQTAWGDYYQRGGWYDQGGMLQPGLNVVANGTGKPEPVLTNDQWTALTERDTLRIDNLTLSIDAGSIDDIQKIIDVFNQLPQAVRANRAGTLRRSGTR